MSKDKTSVTFEDIIRPCIVCSALTLSLHPVVVALR